MIWGYFGVFIGDMKFNLNSDENNKLLKIGGILSWERERVLKLKKDNKSRIWTVVLL